MGRKRILVYIEGEGGGGTTAKRRYLGGEFRKSWGQFLQPLAEQAKKKGIGFQCIPGRGGMIAVSMFSKPLPMDRGALRILLIDSEGPVTDNTKPWKALGRQPPQWATDRHCYLMVQCLETWLLADVDGLKEHYNRDKACFRGNKVKAWPNLEMIAKKTVQTALKEATADCKHPYTHADGNLLIAVVERSKLMRLSSVARLFKDLAEEIEEYAK